MMKKLSPIFITVILLFSTAIAAQAEIELTYWTHEDPNRTEIENRYISEFEKANPNRGFSRLNYMPIGYVRRSHYFDRKFAAPEFCGQ